MDLKLHWTEKTSVLMRHDCQVAEDENHLNVLREPGQLPGSFFGTLSFCSFDKGKPVERRGRKAMGLNLATLAPHAVQVSGPEAISGTDEQ